SAGSRTATRRLPSGRWRAPCASYPITQRPQRRPRSQGTGLFAGVARVAIVACSERCLLRFRVWKRTFVHRKQGRHLQPFGRCDSRPMQQACPPRRSSGPPGHGPSGLDAPVEESFSTRPNARQLRSTLRPRGAPVLAIALVVFGAAVPSVRHGALRRVGGLLVVSDPIVPGDVVAISESGGPGEFQAAEIEAADLVQRRQFSRVMLLRADDMDRMSDELARRGVRLEDPVLATLRQLGVPESAIVTVDAG